MDLKIYIGDYYQQDTVNANLSPQKQINLLLDYLNKCIESDEDIVIYTNSIYILEKINLLYLHSVHNIECNDFKHKLKHISCFEVNNEIKEVKIYDNIIDEFNILNKQLLDFKEEYEDINDMI